MIYRLIGVTGYSLGQVQELTWPQVEWLLEGAGQILYPRLKPALDAQFAKISSKPNQDNPGGVSDTRKIINDYRATLARPDKPLTPEEQERREAYQILYAAYLPPQTEQEHLGVEPLPGVPPETAQAVIEFAAAGGFPPDIWAADVVVLWREIQATAKV